MYRRPGFATLILVLFAPSPALLGREPIAVLEAKNKELREQKGDWQALSEVTRALDEARKELDAAIARGSLSELRRELAAGLDPGHPNNWRILSTAVCKHRLAAVRLVVRSMSDAKHALTISGSGNPWGCAAEIGDPALAWALLEAGPPLGWDREIVQEVIRKGALELFKLSPERAVPRAVELGHLGIARRLLAASRYPDSVLQRSIHESLVKKDAALAQGLLELDAGGSWLPVAAKTSLLEDAAGFSDAAGIAVLLEAGAEPTRQVLERAAEKDRPEVMRALVAGGADPWLAMAVSLSKEAKASLEALAQDTLYTPRGTWAKEVGAEKMARDLLEGGLDAAHHQFLTTGGRFDLEGRDEQGRTGLIRAAEKGDLQLAGLYLEAGADPDGRDRRGRTALAAAARAHEVEVMSALRQAGATEVRTDEGRSPAEEFWAGFSPQGYTNLDPKGARLAFTLPSSFFSPCHGSADATGGFLFECSGEHDMKVAILARRAPLPAALRAILSPARSQGQEVRQEDAAGAARGFSVTGPKGFLELGVTAIGPDALAPELTLLAQKTWQSLSSPLTSATSLRSVQNVVYVLLVVLLVILAVALRLRRRAVTARRS